MNEVWRPVGGFEGFLEVSDHGRIRTLDTIRTGVRCGKPHPQLKKGVVMSPFVLNNGYLCVAPKFGDIRKKLLVHRLVALAFVDGYFEGATVNHIDGDKLNNRFENLEWVTLSRNTAHQWEIGLIDLRGEKHPSAKLSDADVVAVRESLNKGERVSAVAMRYGVSDALIYKIRRGTKRSSVGLPTA